MNKFQPHATRVEMTLAHSGQLERRRRAAGFTLIELMVTVAIVAMLTAIAYPSYRNYVIRGQVTTATDALSALQANMERYFQDNRTYVAVNTFTPPCITAQAAGAVGPSGAQFMLSCSQLTASAYTLQAVGSSPSTAAFTYTLDNFGNQTTTIGAGGPPGWSSCPTGWETKPGQC